MPSALGLGGSAILSANETTLFDQSEDVISTGVQACAAVYTINNGTGAAFIRNPAINGAANYYQMVPGQIKDFIIARAGGVAQLFGKSDAAGTVISGAPTGAN